MYDYDFAVFIGRFQPFHEGHKAVVLAALKRAERVILVMGSANSPRTTRNPFTLSEREAIMRDIVGPDVSARVDVTSVPDFVYNDQKWIGAIQAVVFSAANRKWRAGPTKIALAGLNKDETSYYLNLFPSWDSIDVPQEHVLSSTDIRKAIFGLINSGHLISELTPYLEHTNNAEFAAVAKEFEFEQNYSKKWGKGPFITSDALVVQSGHLLLVERGGEYGAGKWALPGGFVNQGETFKQAMIRELREETKLKVPDPVIAGSIETSKIYDDPFRDGRGRIISQAYLVRLRDLGTLPRVKGSDDAAKARWFSISEFMGMGPKMFADHFHVICDLLKI